MKLYIFNYISIFLLILIKNINCDCNYITLGVDKDVCGVIDKEDKKKTCCYVKIKKNDYEIEYCHEIINNKSEINKYKNEFKKNHSLSWVKVECSTNYINLGILLLIFILLW